MPTKKARKPKFPVPEIQVKSKDPVVKALVKRIKKKADELSAIRDDLRTLIEEAKALEYNTTEAVCRLDEAVDGLSELV